MTSSELLNRLVSLAKEQPAPKELLDFCDGYYEPYYNFIYLAGQMVSGHLVELGCEKGRGLLAMALTGKDVIGFDLNRPPSLDLSQYPNITFFQESSLPVHPFLEGKSIGLLHIDTEHTYTQAKNEFNAYTPYLSKPSVIIFDDLHAREDDVLRFFEELSFDKIQDDELHPGCGWGAVIYE